jgi:hypothetical protein
MLEPEDLIEDPIAQAVAEFTQDGARVVTFCGWVKNVDDVTLHIYDDGDFNEYFAIKIADVVYQLVGDSCPHENFRSVLWVDASASITRCERGTALFFHPDSSQSAGGADPAGGYIPPRPRP